MTLSSAPWWCAPVLALAWMWTVPAQIFCAPTRAKLIAAARFMPGVCGVLVSSWSPEMTLTPLVFQSMPPVSCCSLISPFRKFAGSGSRNRHAAVHWQDLPGDHARLVGGQIEGALGDVARLYEAEEVRVGELLQCGVARHQRLDALGHRRRRGDRVDPHPLRRIGDGERAGDRGDPALGGGVAVAPRDPHQRDVRAHVDDRAAARFDDRGDAEATAQKGAVE